MLGVLDNPPDPASVELLSRTPFYNSRLRTTCVATMIEGGHAENALPQSAKATVNCRVLPGESIDAVQRTIETVIGDSQVAVSRINSANPSPPSPLTAEVLGPIESITENMWPGIPVIPTMSTGATDGLYLRNAGIPVYGVSGLFGDIDDIRAHGQNERIRADIFFEGQEFLYRLTTALATADSK
jgi:acetylornithine deacetylase/succinyl-diaminopimelate desuccinylase-like protein